MEKKRMLILGIEMHAAGTEKSFLSFLSALDRERYDIELLLARRHGDLLSLLPSDIRVTEMGPEGELFTLNGGNAAGILARLFVKRNPLVLFEILPYFLKMKLFPEKRAFAAMDLWVRMMKKLPRKTEKYDVAIAYWGDKTMFYMADKVQADTKIAWLHFDYSNPPRSDATYLPCFKACDAVVTVSDTVDRALRDALPEIADRCVMIENIVDGALLWDMARTAETFDDGYDGVRILSVMRICHQKGFDFIPSILTQLVSEGREFRWYIVGGGDPNDLAWLQAECDRLGVADRLVLLGTTKNPYGYIRDCDVFVLPSRHEGKPISVEEAKAFHRPIVVGHYLSADEQLDSGALGVIAESNPEAIAAALSPLVGSAAHRAEMAQTLKAHNAGKLGNAEREIAKFYEIIRKKSEKK